MLLKKNCPRDFVKDSKRDFIVWAQLIIWYYLNARRAPKRWKHPEDDDEGEGVGEEDDDDQCDHQNNDYDQS